MKRDAVERGITSWQGILLILATIVKNPKLDRLIVFWAPPSFPSITEFQGIDEMGFASLSRHDALPATPYEIREMLAEVTHRKYEDFANFKVMSFFTEIPPSQNPEIPPSDAIVIDFRQLRLPR